MERGMDVQGSVALVTGANRGLGKACAEALLAAGAAKIYAGARDPRTVTDRRLTPVRLDVTNVDDIAAAAERCADADLLVNNAGIMLATPILDPGSEAALRAEMEVNVFGMLAMARAFAPILARNGGGAIVNMLSVVSWHIYPFNATYGASKHAALAVTDALRVQLKAQGTRVVGVYAGFLDTDMAARVDGPKTAPLHVALRMLDGLRTGADHVFGDAYAERMRAAYLADPAAFAAGMQRLWDEGRAWSS